MSAMEARPPDPWRVTCGLGLIQDRYRAGNYLPCIFFIKPYFCVPMLMEHVTKNSLTHCVDFNSDESMNEKVILHKFFEYFFFAGKRGFH
jgi:hypothetical protein